jgi:glycosyltransferase involved in cell wall biosynthesis
LAGDCQFTILVPLTDEHQEQEVREFSEKFDHVKVKPVRCYEKRPVLAPAANFRSMVGRFLRWVFPAPKSPDNSCRQHNGEKLQERLPHYPFSVLDQRYINALAAEIGLGYDLFQGEFIDMLTLGILVPKDIPKLFIHHQLHFMYARRMIAENGNPSQGARYLANRIALEEAAFLNAYDNVVVFSGVDAAHLRTIYPSPLIEVSPFPSPENPVEQLSSHEEEAKAFVLLASEYHPNIEGLNWFMKEVWPVIKSQRPGSKIQVVGRWGEGAIASIADSAEIEFLGFVPDVSVCLQNSIMIVPLWVGSGIRSKILVAWSAGCPVVSTSVGIEGIDAVSGSNAFIADTAVSFADACLKLASDSGLRNEIAQSAWSSVKSIYSIEAVRAKRLEIYNSLLNGKLDTKESVPFSAQKS